MKKIIYFYLFFLFISIYPICFINKTLDKAATFFDKIYKKNEYFYYGVFLLPGSMILFLKKFNEFIEFNSIK